MENKNSMGVGGGRVVTKAQVLVRWAFQKGFGCAPRWAGFHTVCENWILMSVFIIVVYSWSLIAIQYYIIVSLILLILSNVW